MTRRLAFWLLAFVLAGGGKATAQMRALPEGMPSFSSAEVLLINRNDALRALVERSPWAARHVLDVMSQSELGQARSMPIAPSGPVPETLELPGRNPDIDRTMRASPEAARDLFQLLKQVSQQQRPQGRN
jgi:hypothetical protein